jgi:hypothetical protein
MLLRHATLKKNLRSIGRLGLLTAFSKGKRPVVWLHSESASEWAALHVCRRHHGRIEDVVVIELTIPRRWLRRNRRRLWYCTRDLGPARFKQLVTFAELSSSPVSE